MSDSTPGNEIVARTVEVVAHTRKPPAMRGYDKVTVTEKTTTERTVTYEKKPRR